MGAERSSTDASQKRLPQRDAARGRAAGAWSLRTHFVVFGLILVIPLAILTAFLIVELSNASRDQLQQRVVQVANSVAAEIDRELERRISILQTLAYSPALLRGDFASFHAHALAALGDEQTVIILSKAPSLQQVVNTFRPYGSDLPTYGSPETARRAIESKTWQISDFFIGRVSKRPAFDIVLPIVKRGDVEYLLSMGLEPPMLLEILKAQKLPAAWVINVADRNGVILARSNGEARIGTRLTRTFATQPPNTVITGTSLEGTAVLRATARSRLAGWQIAVNLPLAAAEGPLERNIGLLVVWTLAALILTTLFAALFARRLSSPIAAAAKAAAGLAEGRPVPALASRIAEANRLIAALREAAGKIAAGEEQQRRAYEQLESEKARTEGLFHQRETIFEANPNGMLVVDREGRIDLVNRALARMFGYEPEQLAAKPLELLVPPRYRAHHAALRAGYFGQPSLRPMGAGRDLYGLRMDGSEFPIEIGLSPFRSDGCGMALAVVVDITERKRVAEREKLLNHELEHRTKNLFSVIQALAQRTLSGDERLETARKDFLGRIAALARADRRLLQSAATGTSLREIILFELEPFAANIQLAGPEVMLNAQRAQNFALAIHELGTNAVKHGALSKPGGGVAIAWTVADAAAGSVLTFRWREHGGPPVTRPSKEGFGTPLLRVALGQGQIEYAPDGLTYSVEILLGKSGPAS